MDSLKSRIKELEQENSQLKRDLKLVLKLNEELREENKRLRKENSELRIKIEKLEKKVEKLSIKPNQPPSSKPDYEKGNLEFSKNKSGQKPGHKGVSRLTPTQIDKEVEYEVHKCEHCNSTNLVDFQKRSKVITDLEFQTVNIKEYYYDAKCLCCGKTTKAKSAHGRFQSPFGKTIQTLGAYLSSICGATKQNVENLFRDFFRVQISDTSLINSEIRNSKELITEYNNYLELVKQAKFSHKDETTYRVDGKTNWIWVYDSIKYVFYRLANTRSMSVVNTDFENNLNQISINDCYGGYNRFYNQQICWAHILRECKFHFQKENATSFEKKFYKKLLKIYKQAIKFASKRPPIEKRQIARADYENKLCKLMLSVHKKTEF